jgi:hypothetical protein
MAPHNLGFDPEALRAKCLAKRDRRIRSDGKAQYQGTQGAFGYYAEDPVQTWSRPASRCVTESRW